MYYLSACNRDLLVKIVIAVLLLPLENPLNIMKYTFISSLYILKKNVLANARS